MRTVQYCSSKSAKCDRMRLTKFTRFCGFRKNSHALHIRIRYVPSRNVSICRIRLRDTKLCYVGVFSSFVRWRTNNCSCTSTRWSRGMSSVMSSKLIQLSIIKLPGSLSKGKDRQVWDNMWRLIWHNFLWHWTEIEVVIMLRSHLVHFYAEKSLFCLLGVRRL